MRDAGRADLMGSRCITPDPTKLFSGYPSVTSAHGKLLERQRRRRSDILLHARLQLLHGAEEINVTELADNCEISPQTIYNLIGNRRQIYSAAIEEYCSAMLEALKKAEGDDLFDALAGILSYAAYTNPDYWRRLIWAFFHPRSPIYEGVQRRMRMLFCYALNATKPGAPWCHMGSTSYIAERMSVLVSVAAHEWAIGKLDCDDLRLRFSEDMYLLARRPTGLAAAR